MRTIETASQEASPPGSRDQSVKARDHWVGTLDAVRGGAALYVVGNHASVLLVIGFKQAGALALPPLVKLTAGLSYLFAFGHQAVILFFVLSGFCIHFRQAQRLQSHEKGEGVAAFRAGPYFLRRFRRIVPPYYFAILVTALIDWVIRDLNPAFAAPQTGNFLADNILVQHNGLRTMGGNLLFLQSLACSTWGNNTPLWSLAYEFGFYLFYPVFRHLRQRAGLQHSMIVVFALSFSAIGCSLRFPGLHLWLLPLAAYWFCWVLGAWGAETYVGNPANVLARLHPGVVLFLTAVWLATLRVLPVMVSDTVGAMVCVIILLSLLDHLERRPESLLVKHCLRQLEVVGRFSYSLYLTHVPVIALIWALWYRKYQAMPTNPLLFLVGVGIAIGTGWASFQLVERRFINHA